MPHVVASRDKILRDHGSRGLAPGSRRARAPSRLGGSMPLPEVESTRPASGEEPVLRAVDVSVRFGGVVALNGVTLDARPGEVLGLIGPNGAGKTTLFDVLSGIRPPTSGRIVYRRRRHHPAQPDLAVASRASGGPSSASRCSDGSPSRRTCWSRSNGVAAAVGSLADLVALPTRRRRERDRRARRPTRCSSCAGSSSVRVAAGGEAADRPCPHGRDGPGDRRRAQGAAPRRTDLGPRGARDREPRRVDAARAAGSGRARSSWSSTTSGSSWSTATGSSCSISERCIAVGYARRDSRATRAVQEAYLG